MKLLFAVGAFHVTMMQIGSTLSTLTVLNKFVLVHLGSTMSTLCFPGLKKKCRFGLVFQIFRNFFRKKSTIRQINKFEYHKSTIRYNTKWLNVTIPLIHNTINYQIQQIHVYNTKLLNVTIPFNKSTLQYDKILNQRFTKLIRYKLS